ncbi:hypothetical protein F2P47_05945 [Parvibaculum sedimenti]|uniref:Uncharacterized protein n=1 Tax=Parvibaculum sedimenti TaxID=2608632 RepID=A0A6N6VQC3_9HYPH|nr:hypothetical protein [Parvibaculum sedimenti]KAB7741284.1 hypothetical protein F2P47_05945 [Parvibaculum sedimenti]
MLLTKRQKTQLSKIVLQVEKLLKQSEAAEKRQQKKAKASKTAKGQGRRKRVKRSRVEAAEMRKAIIAARKKGAKVAELAKKYGVSTAYIYMIK